MAPNGMVPSRLDFTFLVSPEELCDLKQQPPGAALLARNLIKGQLIAHRLGVAHDLLLFQSGQSSSSHTIALPRVWCSFSPQKNLDNTGKKCVSLCNSIKVIIILHSNSEYPMNDQLFFAQNPWRTEGWQLEARWVDRTIIDHLLQAIRTGPIQVLTGARRTGKTTLIRQIITKLITTCGLPPSSIFYLNLDDIDLRKEFKANPHLILDLVNLYTGKPIERHPTPLYFFLDEVQKAPDIFNQIKLYYDTFPNQIRFLLSGSGALELHSRSAETFAGRIERTRLYPFSLKELLQDRFSNKPLPSLINDILQHRFDPLQWQEWQAARVAYNDFIQAYLRLNDSQKDFMREIHGGAERLYQTVDLLLGISRVESGKVKADRAPIDLGMFTRGNPLGGRPSTLEVSQQLPCHLLRTGHP